MKLGLRPEVGAVCGLLGVLDTGSLGGLGRLGLVLHNAIAGSIDPAGRL